MIVCDYEIPIVKDSNTIRSPNLRLCNSLQVPHFALPSLQLENFDSPVCPVNTGINILLLGVYWRALVDNVEVYCRRINDLGIESHSVQGLVAYSADVAYCFDRPHTKEAVRTRRVNIQGNHLRSSLLSARHVVMRHATSMLVPIIVCLMSAMVAQGTLHRVPCYSRTTARACSI